MKPMGFVPGPVPHTFPWITITDKSYVLSPPFLSPLATVAAGRRGKMEAPAFAKRGSLLIGRTAAALKGWMASAGAQRIKSVPGRLKWHNMLAAEGVPQSSMFLELSSVTEQLSAWR